MLNSLMYQLFDHRFACEFPLPELAEFGGGEPEFSVRLGEQKSFGRTGFDLAFEWRDQHGRQVCCCNRRGDEYLFTFPHHASYHVSVGDVVTCMPEPGGSVAMLRHLLMNQVIPRFLASKGNLLLHASALTLPSGATVAFVGRSGYGKSTLASAFHREGARLISDDCILLKARDECTTAVGGLQGVRLLPDMQKALFDRDARFDRYSPYSDKQQLAIGNQAPVAARRLDALYILNDPLQEPTESVGINPLSAAQAVMILMHCAFHFDPGDLQAKDSSLAVAGEVVSSGLPVFFLAYPRRIEHLPALLKIIADHAAMPSAHV